MMNRRQLFAGLLAAPLVAATSCAEPESKPSPRKVTRIITVPGAIPMEMADRIARNVADAIKNDKVIVLEDGATYHEFYGEPVPIKFADGGIIDPEKCRDLAAALNHRCTLPVKVIERSAFKRSAGELTVTIKCDSSDFERDMDRVKEKLESLMDMQRLIRGT